MKWPHDEWQIEWHDDDNHFKAAHKTLNEDMEKFTKDANKKIGTVDTQLFFTYRSICDKQNYCLNGYARMGQICKDPNNAFSITTGGLFHHGKWHTRSIVQIAKTAAHEMGTL